MSLVHLRKRIEALLGTTSSTTTHDDGITTMSTTFKRNNKKLEKDEEDDEDGEDTIVADLKHLDDKWVSIQLDHLRQKFTASAIKLEDVFVDLLSVMLKNNTKLSSKDVFKSQIVTLQDLISSGGTQNRSNVFGDVLICRILPASLARHNNVTSAAILGL